MADGRSRQGVAAMTAKATAAEDSKAVAVAAAAVGYLRTPPPRWGGGGVREGRLEDQHPEPP